METPKFRAEYAKSGRAACKGCKLVIAKDTLRLAIMVQSPFFDGQQPNWHHFSCFFGRARPKSVDEFGHFESLRWEDQEKIREKVEGGATAGATNGTNAAATTKGKGKKRAAANGIPDLHDYNVEYAKSSRSKCKLCEEFIPKQEVRITKKDYENEVAQQYGPTERWHHVDCFVKARAELGFSGCASILPGFMTLSPEDQKLLKAKIQPMKLADTTDGPSQPKVSKKSASQEADPMKSEMKKQNELIFKYRDSLKDMVKTELTYLMEYNKQKIPEGVDRMLDRLSDAMAFGALKKCKKCKGQIVFRSGVGYQCIGMKDWGQCGEVYLKPERVSFKVPTELKESYPFLNSYKGKVSERVFTVSPVKPSKSVSSTQSVPLLPLQDMQFVIHKSGSKDSADLKSQIAKLGGKVSAKFNDNVVAVISTDDELKKKKLVKVLKSAQDSDVHVVSEDFVDGLQKSSSRADVVKKLNEKNISEWGSNVEKRMPSIASLSSKSIYPEKSMFKSNKTVAKVTLKGGLAVDPDSKIDKIAHVYRKNDEIYSVVLSLTDIQTGTNKFYKLQVLESDKFNKYWVFRSWGRIGTTIGGNKCDEYSSLNECIELFKELFEDKTGNMWEQRKSFQKKPGKMMMLDVTYGDDDKAPKALSDSDKINSKLAKPVQNLIMLLFDIEQMKKTMLEFELDLNKMPLGKLSQKQILEAFSILKEIQNLNKRSTDKHMLLDRTNRFYTLVPHDFGITKPPMLDSEESINQKIDMLNSLMDIEIAYKLLRQSDGGTGNAIDSHYDKLKAKISVLSPDTEEYKFIKLYADNSHAATHSNYTLDILQVFKVERQGEDSKFKKFNKLPNKKLLWHGSRTTNFAGILSQGLRIAPPEAPPTGYMFGKGVYFADRISKSANYCMTSKKNSTGLILLCEVALGQIHELTRAEFIEKLPAGKNSVKGLGKTCPDPSEVMKTPSGAEVPIGKGIDSPVQDTTLLYNEYIVYDVAQVKIDYLLQMKFNYK